jgi:hypothetical protein
MMMVDISWLVGYPCGCANFWVDSVTDRNSFMMEFAASKLQDAKGTIQILRI